MERSLAHTRWMCKYHIVFTPKYRRKIIYNKLRRDIVQIIKDLCKWKGIEIIEGKAMPDHVFGTALPNGIPDGRRFVFNAPRFAGKGAPFGFRRRHRSLDVAGFAGFLRRFRRQSGSQLEEKPWKQMVAQGGGRFAQSGRHPPHRRRRR